MSYLNNVTLIGNLGKDPEVIRTTEEGDFVRLSMATTKRYTTKQGERKVDTQWHVVYLNNRLGRVGASYLHKGDKVFVSGELRTREWFDDEGQRHFNTSVYAKDLRFISVKPQDVKNDEPKSIQQQGHYTKAMEEIREVLG